MCLNGCIPTSNFASSPKCCPVKELIYPIDIYLEICRQKDLNLVIMCGY